LYNKSINFEQAVKHNFFNPNQKVCESYSGFDIIKILVYFGGQLKNDSNV